MAIILNINLINSLSFFLESSLPSFIHVNLMKEEPFRKENLKEREFLESSYCECLFAHLYWAYLFSFFRLIEVKIH